MCNLYKRRYECTCTGWNSRLQIKFISYLALRIILCLVVGILFVWNTCITFRTAQIGLAKYGGVYLHSFEN